MSAMAKMITDMIMKELPDEIRNALTPDNMERVANNIMHKWTFIEGSLNAIIAEQQTQRDILETIRNDYRSSDGNVIARIGGTDANASDGSSNGTSPRTRRRASGD